MAIAIIKAMAKTMAIDPYMAHIWPYVVNLQVNWQDEGNMQRGLAHTHKRLESMIRQYKKRIN